MSEEKQPLKKEDDKKASSKDFGNVRFTVMPKEFRKVAPQKKGIPKIFIFGGVGLVIVAGVATAFVLLMPKEEQIAGPPVSPPVTEVEEPEPGQPTTTTPGGSSLFPTTPTSTEPEEPPEPVTPSGQLVQGTDNDADGLTEKEEAIFQTDSTRPDSDLDGFLDGNEIFHLYNPAALAPTNLLESGIVKAYRNASEGYTIYYPALWSTSSTSDTSRISFLAKDTESINVVIVEASASITLRSWYISQYPDRDINELQSYTNKGGLKGLQDKNRLNTYIKKDDKVYIINYDLGGTNTIWYRRTYDMMLNSLSVD